MRVKMAKEGLWCYPESHANSARLLMWIYIKKVCPGGAEPSVNIPRYQPGMCRGRCTSLDKLLPRGFSSWKIILFIFQSRIEILRRGLLAQILLDSLLFLLFSCDFWIIAFSLIQFFFFLFFFFHFVTL